MTDDKKRAQAQAFVDAVTGFDKSIQGPTHGTYTCEDIDSGGVSCFHKTPDGRFVSLGATKIEEWPSMDAWMKGCAPGKVIYLWSPE